MTNYDPSVLENYISTLEMAKCERPMQQYFEKFPDILLRQYCNAWNFTMTIPQFSLGGEYRPDFVLVTGHSGCWIIHMIELESPRAVIYNKAGTPGRKLATAIRQLQDWAIWKEQNRSYYIDRLAQVVGKRRAFTAGMTPNMLSSSAAVRTEFHIIIGRRHMLTDEDNRRRGYFETSGFGSGSIATYDRVLDTIRNNPVGCGNLDERYMNKARKRFITRLRNTDRT